MATLLTSTSLPMHTAKERVLLDKEGNCVPADDPAGVQVLAGFAGAQVPEKKLRGTKGFKKFFTSPEEKLGRADELGEQPAKRVVAEAKPAHAKPAVIKP